MEITQSVLITLQWALIIYLLYTIRENRKNIEKIRVLFEEEVDRLLKKFK